MALVSGLLNESDSPTHLATPVLPANSYAVKNQTPFDGQYLKPNATNSAVEWWWGQSIADPVGDKPPAAFQFLFYQGVPSSERSIFHDLADILSKGIHFK